MLRALSSMFFRGHDAGVTGTPYLESVNGDAVFPVAGFYRGPNHVYRYGADVYFRKNTSRQWQGVMGCYSPSARDHNRWYLSKEGASGRYFQFAVLNRYDSNTTFNDLASITTEGRHGYVTWDMDVENGTATVRAGDYSFSWYDLDIDAATGNTLKGGILGTFDCAYEGDPDPVCTSFAPSGSRIYHFYMEVDGVLVHDMRPMPGGYLHDSITGEDVYPENGAQVEYGVQMPPVTHVAYSTDAGFLFRRMDSVLKPPYSVAFWFRQSESYPSYSYDLAPLVASMGCDGNSGVGFGRQEGSDNLCMLNDGKYWNQYGTNVRPSDRNWHYCQFTVDDSDNPFRLFVDGTEKDALIYNEGAVRDVQPGQYLCFLSRTVDGESSSYRSQWFGSISRISMWDHALSDSEIEADYDSRKEKLNPSGKSHAWSSEVSNGIVKDLVGGWDLSVHGDVFCEEVAIEDTSSSGGSTNPVYRYDIDWYMYVPVNSGEVCGTYDGDTSSEVTVTLSEDYGGGTIQMYRDEEYGYWDVYFDGDGYAYEWGYGVFCLYDYNTGQELYFGFGD